MKFPRSSGNRGFPYSGKTFIQLCHDLDLLLRRAVHEVVCEEISAARVQIRQSLQKDRAFLRVIPLRNDDIDELVDSGLFCAGSISLRNDDLSQSGDSGVLMGVQSFQRG